MDLTCPELPRAALFLAGRAFVKYQRKVGARNNMHLDFIVRAHAAVLICGIFICDGRRHRSDFPRVALVDPQGGSAS